MANSVFGARTGFGAPTLRREVAGPSDDLEAQLASRGQRDRQAALDVILGTRAAAAPVAVPVAVIDGPYDAAALSGVLARAPVSLGNGGCGVNPKSACIHGTFVMGLLGARRDALIPGICPDCQLLHVPLFMNEDAPQASVVELANAIMVAVKAGARLINLSLAILGDDAQDHRELAAALDCAEASGAVVVAAAGNQGHLAMGQLLSHPVTVPVVAADAAGRPLPDCNFGPSISRRGVAAFGHQVLGYAPGGGTTTMSATSVATAVATGILALVWSARRDVDGAMIRAAVARLDPRNGPVPPILDLGALFAALDQRDAATVAVASAAERGKMNFVTLQGGTTMIDGNGLPRSINRGAGLAAISAQAVTPAQGLGGCGCGAPGGLCTCTNGDASPSRFVYVLGTVDIRFPDQSISGEFQNVARTIGVEQRDDEDLRSWCHRVLTDPEGRKARYIARQLCWILTVTGLPVYYLVLRDLYDLDDLISCLGEPLDDELCLFVGSSSLIPIERCPGVTAPVLAVDYLCSFKKHDLMGWFNVPPAQPARTKRATRRTPPEPVNLDEHYIHELYRRLFQSSDNRGDEDRWRAVNYLAVRYPPLYAKCAEMAEKGYKFKYFDVAHSRLMVPGENHILDPLFVFNDDNGDVVSYFVRLDLNYLFPMIIKPITEYSKKL